MELQQLKKELLTKSSDHRDLSFDFNILAKHVLKVKDDELNPFTIINEAQAKKIRRLMKKHLHGVPIQKMIGYSIFHDCYIPYSKHTLTPRLETELLVEKILETINHKKYKVLDMCTGSGCIGIAIVKASSAEVVCSDISKKAIRQCRQNAKLNNVKIEVVESNMFDNIKEKFDIIICNPPYISKAEYKSLDKLVRHHDPKIALVATEDGLHFYKLLAKESLAYLKDNGKLFLEVGYNQGDAVSKLLLDSFNKIEVVKDYSNNDRIIVAEKSTKEG